jgi:hypothetical protein
MEMVPVETLRERIAGEGPVPVSPASWKLIYAYLMMLATSEER